MLCQALLLINGCCGVFCGNIPHELAPEPQIELAEIQGNKLPFQEVLLNRELRLEVCDCNEYKVGL